MRFLTFLAVVILVAQALPQAALARDTYILALSWQPAFCETAERRPECREQTKERADTRQFSLHGLWPQPANRSYCGVADTVVAEDKAGRWHKLPIDWLPQELWNRLRIAMPGTRSGLHRHEWIKHGTCATGNAQTYYSRSLALVEAVNRSDVARLFAGSIGNALTADAIRASFESAFGPGAGRRVKVVCVEDGERRLIVEITIGLGGQLSDTPDIATLIMAAPPTDPGCPGGIVDPAGLQ